MDTTSKTSLPNRDPLVVAAGLLSIVTGVVAVFVERDGTTTTVLVSAGFALLALVYLGPRLLSLKVGSAEIVLAAAEAAKDADREGDVDGAEAIRRSVADYIDGLSSAAAVPNALQSEQSVLGALSVLAQSDTEIRTNEPLDLSRRGRPWRPDVSLTRGQRRLVIEVLNEPSAGQMKRIVEVLERAAGVPDKDGRQIRYAVLADEASVAKLLPLAQGNFDVITWGFAKDHAALRNLLSQALGQ